MVPRLTDRSTELRDSTDKTRKKRNAAKNRKMRFLAAANAGQAPSMEVPILSKEPS